ncbi:phenylacetate--CoA ligase family protein [Pontibacillus salipaludis]|uniref:Capsular polysaccharide biosynthesis protein n=1 Tax=Pontibacillus salipaludis TaxID=1697394 RepID=A0ABQ1QJQ8_9BACI|nr:phenylacetate--CoA ligase family protein [Pontibacillus salipaludis]GGD28495.1 capsular polysaccharide biosynthesis protein [Pontibacillus salipaludis]
MNVINKSKLKVMEKIRKTDALKVYEEYQSSQWWDQEQLISLQEKKLRSLIEHSYQNVPYFREYMTNNGLMPEDITSIQDLERLPVIDKTIIKGHKNEFLANDMDKYDPDEKRTGGSTGEPLKYYVSKESHSLMWGNIWRGWSVSGYTPGDKVAVLAGGSLLSGFDYKRQLYYYLNNWLPFSSYDMSKEKMSEYVDKLKKGNIEYLYAYSSSAFELANFIMEHQLTVNLKGVITTSEVLFPHYRAAIEKAFGCKVYDQYGANDGGVTAFECEYHNGLHVGMERCIVEVVDEEGHVVPDGVEGRILLTDLSNYAMPFIRYEVGDYGALTYEPCPCGRGLIRLTHIKGRKQEFIYTEEREKVHGGFFSTTFRQHDEIDQFQVVQTVPGKVSIRLKINDGAFSSKLEDLEKHILEKGQLNEVEFELTDTFTKTKGGKHKFIINEVD